MNEDLAHQRYRTEFFDWPTDDKPANPANLTSHATDEAFVARDGREIRAGSAVARLASRLPNGSGFYKDTELRWTLQLPTPPRARADAALAEAVNQTRDHAISCSYAVRHCQAAEPCELAHQVAAVMQRNSAATFVLTTAA